MERTCSTYGGEERCLQDFKWGNLREGNYLKDQGVGGKTILKRIFQKFDEGHTGSIWLRIGTGGGLL
jgi:hypothetical protein